MIFESDPKNRQKLQGSIKTYSQPIIKLTTIEMVKNWIPIILPVFGVTYFNLAPH